MYPSSLWISYLSMTAGIDSNPAATLNEGDMDGWMDGFSTCNKGVFVPYFMSWFHQSKNKTATSLKLGKIVDCWVITCNIFQLQIVAANIWLPRGCSTLQPLLSVWLKMITHWKLIAQLAWWEATCPKQSQSNLDHKLRRASHSQTDCQMFVVVILHLNRCPEATMSVFVEIFEISLNLCLKSKRFWLNSECK